MNNNERAYEQLFKSFVNGGGLDDNDLDDNFDDNFDGGKGKAPRKPLGAKKGKKASPKAKKPSPKAKKAKNVDGVKEVEVDVFTVVQSSIGVSGGNYKSRTPRSAALKAAGSLFKSRPSARTLKFVMQKITPNSNKRVYAYQASIEIFDEPEVVIKHDKNGKELRIPITRKVSIKKIEVDEDIRREQKEALKAERKARHDKEKAKMMKAERAEMRARGEKPAKKAKAEKAPKKTKKAPKKAKAEKAPKKVKAEKKDKEVVKALKKAEKQEKKLLKKADELLTKYSKSIQEEKKKGKKAKAEKKPTKKGKGKKNEFWGGGACGTNSCN